ncbi:SusC/RagA family TonB-linked outer membrane protein [Dysgonomonas sp. GY617]|uniref:SusC/RagA family TonB-linked outer membrane protein n=1 Tax=Dysgonomonas sp. GY617 TaxID=2780420 RepID=UPI0018846998|nr:TonB-dependent receptor [Dysgonomonas sp. GY617]MBF0574436.1 TonB-dependent receptor [Dysgonomonas sp. GY617]
MINKRVYYSPLFRRILIGGTMLFLTTGIAFAEKNIVVENTAINQTDQRQVAGTIVDQSGDPIIGATVIVKGTTVGTVTDLDGKFTINVPSNAVIAVQYVGYLNQEVRVGDQTTLNITLKEDTQTLDEVVVVGYGVQKKVNLSGSVANIRMNELVESRPISNISQGLAGMAAGVQVTSGSNRPGDNTASIMIRGQGTLNNAAPLVIIDGVEGSLSSVDPQDIEDLSVLKDAASAAIYGSRAANGVILITTRMGKKGDVKIEYNGYMSWESVGKTFDLVSNYANYMELINEGYSNSNLPTRFTDKTIQLWRDNERGDQLMYPNTNLMDELFSTSLGSNHNLALSGGSDKFTFFTSFGFLNTPGVMENSGYKKYNTRINLEANVKPWLKLGTNLSGHMAFTEQGTNKVKDVFTYSAATTPGMVFRAPDGRYGSINNSEDDAQTAANNPFYRLNNTTGDIESRNIKTRFYGTLAPFKGFTLTGSFNYIFTNKTDDSKPVFIEQWNFLTNTLTSTGIGKTSIMNNDYKWNNYTMDAVARYENKVSKLDYSAMVGASQELFRYKWFKTTKQDLLDPGLGAIDGATGAASSSGNTVEWAMRSFFSRINLNWDNKYLFEFNLRADGSSRFLKDNRWGYFPSASAAWRVDQEPFMTDLVASGLSNMKFRASYGVLGNNALRSTDADINGNYDAQSLYSSSNYILNNEIAMGIARSAIPNALLTWERSKITNLAVDMGFINNKLTGTIEVFHKKTDDILIDLPAPLVNGNASIPRQNAGTVVNKGLELTAGWQDKIQNVSYFVNGNATFLNNKVTRFKGDESSLDGANMIKEGYAINTQFGYKVDRLVQTQADLDYVQALVDNAPIDPATGKQRNPFSTIKRPELGDLLYKDTNGDGVLNDDDRVPIGNGKTPKFTFGLNFGASYRGFDCAVLIQGVTGVEQYWLDNYFRPQVRSGYQLNKQLADGRWHKDMQGSAKYPRLLEFSDDRNTRVSDFWVQNKSFVKIKNIQLGYTLPKALVNRFSLDKLRIYGSLENFFTFTKYDGLDPEVSGVDYPTMRQAVIGINLSF